MSNDYFFIKRPKLAIVISLVILFAGILLIFDLPLEEYPSITPPQVVVTATYSGASSDVVEDTIAAPIEEQLNGVENMIYMTSTSRSGSYELTLYFEVGTDSDMAVVNVQNQLQLAVPRLPEEARRYGLSVKKSTGGPGLLMISVNSPNKSYDSLFISNFADIYIKDELARVKGVGKVSVFGTADYSMRIWLDAYKMYNYNLSANDIVNAITAQNTQVPAGDLGVEPLNNPQMIKLTMKTKGRLKDVKEFENIILKAESNGAIVRLKDVARVELGAESYSNFSRINGKDSAIIMVSQMPEANAIDLSNRLRAKLKELSKDFPPDIEYKVERDETDFVRASIHEVIEAVLIAVLLVGLVTYLFLGTLKSALIPFAAIPISILGVFIFMKFFGFSINLLILFAFVLAVGLVVDDAIVVLENSQRHIQEGKTPKEATNITIKEVLGAVIATSLVLMAVFVPVSFLGGITGQMFRQFALCISASIGLSTLVALTLTPALCSIMLTNNTKTADFKIIQKFDNWFNNLKNNYNNYVNNFISSSYVTIILLILISILSVILFIFIPKGFLPQEDRGAAFTQLQLSDGSTATRTDKVAKVAEEKIKKIPGVRNTITLVGLNGENTAFIVSQFENWKKRNTKETSLNGILSNLRKEFAHFPSAVVATFSPPAISGLGMFGGFEYQLLDKGDKGVNELYKQALEFIDSASKNDNFTTVYTSYSANLPQLQLDINMEKAVIEGVEINEIYNTLGAYFAKTYVNDFNKFNRVYRVYLQADSEFRADIPDLDNIYVKNKFNKMVPLSSLITVKNIIGPYSRTRFNMYPAITINGNTKSGVSSGTGMETLEKISNEVLGDGFGYAWSGTSLQEKKSSGQIIPVLLMSLGFIYLFLVGLYESWLLPISVLLITPIALFGALLLQYLTGTVQDVYAQIGLVMLIGLSTKQAILIVEFANDEHKKGVSIIESAINAASLRFRAVMMTNIAFILGLLPLAFAKGAGAVSRHSVGITVIGGMLAVSFIGTFLVPVFFVLVENFNEYLKTKLMRKI